LEEQNLLPAEEKGCHPGSKSCKDQLVISESIYEGCKRKKNVRIAWIDYHKASDSISHRWVEKSIELVQVNSKKRLHLKTKQEVMQLQPMHIHSGIFQGDSLSPLLFCIALISLTHKLSRPDCGYQVHRTERKIIHLLYMDDLKLLGSNEDD